jgi:hypothetical protein
MIVEREEEELITLLDRDGLGSSCWIIYLFPSNK